MPTPPHCSRDDISSSSHTCSAPMGGQWRYVGARVNGSFTHIFMCAHMHTHTHTHTRLLGVHWMLTQECRHAHTYIHIHAHTHTHTHTNPPPRLYPYTRVHSYTSHAHVCIHTPLLSTTSMVWDLYLGPRFHLCTAVQRIWRNPNPNPNRCPKNLVGMGHPCSPFLSNSCRCVHG